MLAKEVGLGFGCWGTGLQFFQFLQKKKSSANIQQEELEHREKVESWMRIQDWKKFDALGTCDNHRLS